MNMREEKKRKRKHMKRRKREREEGERDFEEFLLLGQLPTFWLLS